MISTKPMKMKQNLRIHTYIKIKTNIYKIFIQQMKSKQHNVKNRL